MFWAGYSPQTLQILSYDKHPVIVGFTYRYDQNSMGKTFTYYLYNLQGTQLKKGNSKVALI
jgi:hypothetical protein